MPQSPKRPKSPKSPNPKAPKAPKAPKSPNGPNGIKGTKSQNGPKGPKSPRIIGPKEPQGLPKAQGTPKFLQVDHSSLIIYFQGQVFGCSGKIEIISKMNFDQFLLPSVPAKKF
jgi:hypothetical protein